MAIQKLGPLDWRMAIVDKGGRPTPEFQRRWNLQRQNNELITHISVGEGDPEDPATNGEGYIDVGVEPAVFWIGYDDEWVKVGPSIFTDLLDVPDDYTGEADSLVQVNPTEDGLIFTPLADFTDNPTAVATDVAVNGTSEKFMRADAAPAVRVATSSLVGLINDAPSDSIPYARNNAAWQKLGAAFGINVTGKTVASGGVGEKYTIVIPYPCTFAQNYPLSYAKAGTAATGSSVFTILKNGGAAGTITFAAAGTTATWASASAISFVAGDVLTISAPTTADATLADIGITFVGTRN